MIRPVVRQHTEHRHSRSHSGRFSFFLDITNAHVLPAHRGRKLSKPKLDLHIAISVSRYKKVAKSSGGREPSQAICSKLLFSFSTSCCNIPALLEASVNRLDGISVNPCFLLLLLLSPLIVLAPASAQNKNFHD